MICLGQIVVYSLHDLLLYASVIQCGLGLASYTFVSRRELYRMRREKVGGEILIV